MSVKTNSPSQENLDYQHALEVIREVSDETVRKLGEEAVKEGQSITFQTGIADPRHVINAAEDITYVTGVIDPEDALEVAEEITAQGAEIEAAGENLPLGEHLGETPVTDAAEAILLVHNMNEQLGGNNQSKPPDSPA